MTEDEFERLSRYRAGELPADEARALEDHLEFAAGMKELERLDATASALPLEYPPERLEALLARVRRPEPRSTRRRDFFVGLAVLTLALLAGVTSLRPRGARWELHASGDVTVNGRPAAERQQVTARDTLRSGADGRAELVSGTGWMGLSGGSELDGLRLTQGNATLSSDSLALWAGDVELEVRGVAVVSMEPPEGVARVTDTLNHLVPGASMKTQWMKLPAAAVGGAIASAAVTLFVLEGTAVAHQGGAAPGVTVAAGERWAPSPDAPQPVPFRAPVAVASAPAPRPAVKEPELETLGKPELIALVSKLRDEKEALLRTRGTGKPWSELGAPATSNYRAAPEELAQLAKDNTVRFHLPMLPVPEAVVGDLRLTSEEQAALKAAVDAAAERKHQGLLALYGEIGGDAALASTLASSTLMGEIQNKSLKDEWANALRQVAKERAGLVPVQGEATAMLRAFRLEVAEDEQVIDALDQILGPGRAERFMNHDSASGVRTYRAGP